VIRRFLPLLLCFGLLWPCVVLGHELMPGYLELEETAQNVYDVIWKLPLQRGARLPLAPRFPDDCALEGNLEARLERRALVYGAQLTCEASLQGRVVSIDGLRAVGTEVLLRVTSLNASGTETILIQPEKGQALIGAVDGDAQQTSAFTYLRLGIEHILLGVDHLMFVLALLLIVRDGWTLFKTITAFTVANSVTLSVAAIGVMRVPTPPLNAAIALSILFMAVEVVRSWRGQTSFTIRRPWVVAFGFGLIHGFGYASGLAELGLPRGELLLALLLFNIGIEIGQDVFVFLVLALKRSFRQLEIHWPRWAVRLPGYAVGVAGAYWTFEHTTALFLLGG
jgi:hydrogenase/urease accessory protein HupE